MKEIDDALVRTVLEAYAVAWNEADAAKRMAALDVAWADGAVYQDPTATAVGRQGLSDHIGGVYRTFPGARLEITSGADRHHDKLRFTWRMLDGDGNEMVSGIDFAVLAPDGRLASITGFFGGVPNAD